VGQIPRHRGLYDLLTDRELTTGIVVRFEIGLTYTVGKGWAHYGRPMDPEDACDLLAAWWSVVQPGRWRTKKPPAP
jgi:hypothetical protein